MRRKADLLVLYAFKEGFAVCGVKFQIVVAGNSIKRDTERGTLFGYLFQIGKAFIVDPVVVADVAAEYNGIERGAVMCITHRGDNPLRLDRADIRMKIGEEEKSESRTGA